VALERLAQILLGEAARAIDVGGIEEGDTQLQRLTDDGGRLLRIAPAAEVIAAKPDRGDLQS
jgi:hypothetical protein